MSYILCLDCRNRYIERKRIMKLYKGKKIQTKPAKFTPCKICAAYLDMERYFNIHRYKNQDGYKTQSHSNCVVPCGYGMWAPRYYKEQVIDKRRK